KNKSGRLMRAQTYSVANTNVAAMAAIKLLSKNTLPIKAATNTKIAERMVFGQFKCDQSTGLFILRLITGNRRNCDSVLLVAFVLPPAGVTAATSSSIEQ